MSAGTTGSEGISGLAGAVIPGEFGAVRQAAATFWLNFLFENTLRWPWFVRATRSMFLFFAWRCSRTLRDGTTANARWLLGPQSTPRQRKMLGKAIIRDFYDFVYDMGRAVRMPPQRLAQQIQCVEGQPAYFAARAKKKGAIIATAHLGSFEVGMVALTQLEPHVHVVYHRDAHPRFERLRSAQRLYLGVQEAHVEQGLPLWMDLRQALEQDHVVLIQADRVLPGHKGVPMPFLGGHIMMPTGPVKLALATGAPIVPTVSLRTARRKVRIVLGQPIEVHADQGPIDHNHPAMIQLAQFFSYHIQQNPHQWHVLSRAWCEDL